MPSAVRWQVSVSSTVSRPPSLRTYVQVRSAGCEGSASRAISSKGVPGRSGRSGACGEALRQFVGIVDRCQWLADQLRGLKAQHPFRAAIKDVDVAGGIRAYNGQLDRGVQNCPQLRLRRGQLILDRRRMRRLHALVASIIGRL